MKNAEETAQARSASVYDVFGNGTDDGATPINLTIGNPHIKPPACYYEALAEVLRELREEPGNGHGYAIGDDPFGHCRALASDLSLRFGVDFQGTDVLMTVGATGALDVILKTLLCPERGDDEVLVVAPYFLEYLNLVRSNGGVPVVVPSTADFGLDTAAIADAITPRTRAIIVNSPNNPTGKIYSEDSLRELSRVLEAKNRELDLRIAVIEDAVYDSIVFTGRPTPSMIPHYPAMFRVNSYSKSLGLAGERLGHLAVHPGFAPEARKRGLIDSLKLNMRMRVVHAPLLQHRVVARLPLHGLTDVEAYRRNVERLHLTLSTLGFGVMRPEGTFYLWATLPDSFSSEREFQRIAHGGPAPLLYLPGVLFGGDAYSRCVRFSACVPLPEVERACARLHEITSIHTSRPGRPL